MSNSHTACPVFTTGIKVKQKISGCFREPIYAEYFARIKGVHIYVKKNQQDILLNIQNSFELNPFLPSLAE